MNMHNTICMIIISLVLLIVACSSEENPIITIVSGSDGLIPLKVGNSWTYQSTIYDLDSNITFQGTYLQEVLASIVIDNLTWYYIDKEPEAEQYPRYTNKEDGYYEVSNKNEIEKQIGENLEWMDLPGKKASRIKLSSSANLNQEDKWQEYFEWMKSTAELFQKVFGKYKIKDGNSVK